MIMHRAALNPADVGAVANEPLEEITAALFWPMGADGVYGRTSLFERIVDGLSSLISLFVPGAGDGGAEISARDEPESPGNVRLPR
jgi:hypothetical protein